MPLGEVQSRVSAVLVYLVAPREVHWCGAIGGALGSLLSSNHAVAQQHFSSPRQGDPGIKGLAQCALCNNETVMAPCQCR